jgi:hypothetical protein
MTRPRRHLCVIGDSDTISKYVSCALLTRAPIHARRTRQRARRETCCLPAGTAPRVEHAVTQCTASWHPSRTALPDLGAQQDANVCLRGSPFLKAWMEFLEENADLRYPNLADVYVDEQNG